MELKRIDKVRTRLVSGNMLNRVIEQANRADQLSGGPGVSVSTDESGRGLSLDDLPLISAEAAVIARVVNIGADTIPMYGVMGIVEAFHQKKGTFQHERAISVRKPLAEDAGRVAIAIDEIPPKQVGLACIDGVCIVRIVRWFTGSVFNKASLHVDKFYVLADVQGEFDIIWEETEGFRDEEEHLALVRFKRDFVPLKYENTGTKTIEIFQPVLINKVGGFESNFGKTIKAIGDVTDGLYRGMSPPDVAVQAIVCRPSYINLAGPVAVGGLGTMMAGMPGLADIDHFNIGPSNINPGISIGPRSDKQLWDYGSGNYMIMLTAGQRVGKTKVYGAVHYDAAWG